MYFMEGIYLHQSLHICQTDENLTELGIPINDPVLIELPKVKIDDKGISGEVISVDALGNVTTNISGDHLKLLGENIFIKI